MISSFFDPPKATAAANALLAEDINFLFSVMDEPSFLQVANDAGVWAAAWNTDVREFGPDVYVNTLQLDFGPYYLEQAEAALAGTWTAKTEPDLLPLDLGDWGDQVPAEVSAAVDELRPQLLDESLNPYTGPIIDSQGTRAAGRGRDPRRAAGLPRRLGRRGCHRRRRLTPGRRPGRRRRDRRSSSATSPRASTACRPSTDVDLELRRGEVHALLGENGAGKTTLSNVLAGIYRADAGRIEVDGVEHHFHSPAQAIAAGIGMVHQHFRLVAPMTVAENIHLGWDGDAAAGHPARDLVDAHAAADGRVRPARRPDGQGLAAVGRRAAAGRDPARAGQGRADPHPRRAHRRAHRGRGRRAVRGDPLARRSRAHRRVHLAQAQRGARGRRPDHGAAQRRSGSSRATPPAPPLASWRG